MPSRPPIACSRTGCPNMEPCPNHGYRARQQKADERRGSSASRGYDARHRRWREEVLARDPVCVECDLEPSVIADHIIPLDPRCPELGDWGLSNGAGMCRGCHNVKTAKERAA